MMGPGCGQGWEPDEKSRKIRLPSCEISCSFVGLMFVGAEWCEKVFFQVEEVGGLDFPKRTGP